MRTGKTSATFLLCLLLFFAAIPAHGAPQDTQSRAAVTTDVTIIIEQEKVLLTARQAVEYLQLQILDATGEVVFDSGPIQGNEIAWPFQNGAGEAVKSGLYAYRLTVKGAGKERAQTRRGHFIVDRAKDRDGADKLWVTSQESSNVGAELIMVKDENGVIAGTSSNGASVREQRAEIKDAASGEGTENKTAAVSNSLAITAGTPGQISKFTSATDLGDSVMAEVSGNIGIGTAAPSSKLTVQTPTASYGVTHTDGNIALTTWVGNGSTGSGGWFGTRSNHSLHFFTNNGGAKMTITPSGSIGIGTSNPTASRLTIEGQNALSIQGFEPFATLADLNSPDLYSHRIQSAHGDLNFFQGYRPPDQVGFQWTPVMIIKDTGNVGVGTAFPLAKLHVAGSFLRVDGAGNEQAYLGGDGYGSDVQLGSSNPNITNVALWNSASGRNMNLFVSSLVVTGGADFAENFDVDATKDSEIPSKIEAGMVVSIDPANPGKLQLSTQAHDRRVAGIISGAGGVKPGMMMSQGGTMADGKHPVALSGRVFCWADASHGAIEPGDLLTTSATPGHAMKVADATKAQGAIIGKAMTGLKDGKGLVLVLVTLQ
jgi:hypothetical protein